MFSYLDDLNKHMFIQTNKKFPVSLKAIQYACESLLNFT